MQSMQSVPNRQSTIDVPVRILVPSESVGAIIGKGGQTIRQLTQQTRAKVDVYRGDPMTPTSQLQEKVITIRGQPENCINACREILKVMKIDADNKGKPNDIPLKVLAHNDYIGRIIGKQGNIINTIKKDTETTVTVSSINDISMNVERVITVKGELENMIRALEIIHQKIKSAFENDTKTYGAQAIMMGGIPPIPMAPPAYAAFNPPARFNPPTAAPTTAYPNFYPTIFPPFYPQQGFVPQQAQQNLPHAPQPQQHPSGGPSAAQAQANSSSASAHPNVVPQALPPPQQQQQQQQMNTSSSQNDFICDLETVYLYIPNVAVGAIIGTKGQFIKNIIKLSGASVKITPLSPEESKTATERQVVITGTRDSQWKAQYYIYEKIRQERFTTDENIKLRAEIHVPSHIVGRIIGKSGRNVRELQRTTGATIKLPDDANQTQASHVVVRIHGTFNSSQVAQQRIQLLITQGLRGTSTSRSQQMISTNSNGNNSLQMNQSYNSNNNTRSTNGNNRKSHRQQSQSQQQNGPSSSSTSTQQQQQQQNQSGNNSTANSTPTATTPTNNNPSTPNTSTTTTTTTNNDNNNLTTQPQQQQQQSSSTPTTPTPPTVNNNNNNNANNTSTTSSN